MVATATASTGAMAATLERRLGLRKRARADGAAGRPAVDDDLPTAVEQDIAAAIDATAAPLLAERAQIAAQLELSLRRLAPTTTDFGAGDHPWLNKRPSHPPSRIITGLRLCITFWLFVTISENERSP